MRPSSPTSGIASNASFQALVAMSCVLLALSLANSAWAAAFSGVWERTLNVGIDGWQRFRTVSQWIDDALVPLLFLFLSLRLKREIAARWSGTSPRWPGSVAASVGAAVIPLLIYGGAVLSALAFSSPDLSPTAIELAIGLVAVLIILNQLSVRRLSPYLVVGVLLWLALLEGGISPILAGIILASTIPGSAAVDEDAFFERTGLGMEAFERAAGPRIEPWLSRQQFAIQNLIDGVREAQSPLFELERPLQRAVAIIVIPVFLLANAGVTFLSGAFHSISWILVTTIAAGVVFAGAAAIVAPVAPDSRADRSHLGTTPDRSPTDGSRWWRVTLALTVALFVAKAVFRDPSSLDSAKVGLLAGAGLMVLIYWSLARETRLDRDGDPFRISLPHQSWRSADARET